MTEHNNNNNRKKKKNTEIGHCGSDWLLLFPKDLEGDGLHRHSSAGDFDRRKTEARGGFEGESHCWTDPIRLKQDKQLGVDVLCPRLL